MKPLTFKPEYARTRILKLLEEIQEDGFLVALRASQIAHYAKCSEATVSKEIRNLEPRGLIRRTFPEVPDYEITDLGRKALADVGKEPPQKRIRFDQNGCAASVLRFLAINPPTRTGKIAEATHFNRYYVGNTISHLLTRGLIVQYRGEGWPRYTITDEGRAKLLEVGG